MEPMHHPGDGNRFAICDICGCKVRVRDTVLIQDKWSDKNGLLVCRRDADITNPQSSLKSVREINRVNPKYVRVDQPQTYLTNVATAVPSAPLNLQARLSGVDSSSIKLTWEPPYLTGGGRITGYVITRADPQESNQFIIEADTGSSDLYYYDTSADTDGQYTYSVAAINSYGTGAYSALAYYPAQLISVVYKYLTASQNHYVIRTSTTGIPISSKIPVSA